MSTHASSNPLKPAAGWRAPRPHGDQRTDPGQRRLETEPAGAAGLPSEDVPLPLHDHRQLIFVGASHRTTPLALLEAIALAPEDVARALPELRALADLREVMVLSTCNRTEIYATTDNPATACQKLESWLLSLERDGHGLAPDHLVLRQEGDAVSHLLRLSCGVDSMMLGETQIAGQIESALKLARQAGTAEGYLTQLVSAASRTCKRARTETAISTGVVSVASAAAYLAQRIFGDLEKRTALIVGAGETGRLAAEHLRSRGVRKIIVANRTLSRAEALAKDLGGQAAILEVREPLLKEADLAVCATYSPAHLFTRESVAATMKGRGGRMLLLVDISMPRNIDPDAGAIENVFLHDMQDLRSIVDQNLSRRAKEVPAVELIVAREAEGFFRHLAGIQAGPMIRDLRERFEAVRRHELDRFLKRFGEEDRELAERLTRDLIQKLLHHPTVEIREAARHPEANSEKLLWVRRLFGLDTRVGERSKK